MSGTAPQTERIEALKQKTAAAQRMHELEALALRIARLNRDAGEIGPGMLADLVDTARRLTR